MSNLFPLLVSPGCTGLGHQLDPPLSSQTGAQGSGLPQAYLQRRASDTNSAFAPLQMFMLYTWSHDEPKKIPHSWASKPAYYVSIGTIASSPTRLVSLPDNTAFQNVSLFSVPYEHTNTAICWHSICHGPIYVKQGKGTTSKNQKTRSGARSGVCVPAGQHDGMTRLQHLIVTTCQHVRVTHASAPAWQHVSVTLHKDISATTRIMSSYPHGLSDSERQQVCKLLRNSPELPP